jgi:hypothetical protein
MELSYNTITNLSKYWVGDTGASSHFTNTDVGMFNWKHTKVRIGVGDCKIAISFKEGSIRLKVIQQNGKVNFVTLHNCKYIPGLRTNLFSITTALTKGWTLSNRGVFIEVSKDDDASVFDTVDPTSTGVLMMVCISSEAKVVDYAYEMKVLNNNNNQPLISSIPPHLKPQHQHCKQQNINIIIKPSNNPREGFDRLSRDAILTVPHHSQLQQLIPDTTYISVNKPNKPSIVKQNQPSIVKKNQSSIDKANKPSIVHDKPKILFPPLPSDALVSTIWPKVSQPPSPSEWSAPITRKTKQHRTVTVAPTTLQPVLTQPTKPKVFDINKYHTVLGHINEKYLIRTANYYGQVLKGTLQPCIPCTLARSTRTPISKTSHIRDSIPGNRIYL